MKYGTESFKPECRHHAPRWKNNPINKSFLANLLEEFGYDREFTNAEAYEIYYQRHSFYGPGKIEEQIKFYGHALPTRETYFFTHNGMRVPNDTNNMMCMSARNTLCHAVYHPETGLVRVSKGRYIFRRN